MQFRLNYCKTILLIILYLCHQDLIGQKKSDKENYQLSYFTSDASQISIAATYKLKTIFNDSVDAERYVQRIDSEFLTMGFPLATVDSIIYKANGALIYLNIGKHYTFMFKNNILDVHPELLQVFKKDLLHNNYTWQEWILLREKILNYYENNGFPFAAVSLDSIDINQDSIQARLNINKGKQYFIDSIRVYGKAKIKNSFLQRHLFILAGTSFAQNRINEVDKRIATLPFLTSSHASDLTMLSTGSILNLYLEPRKCSQVNFLLGLQQGTAEKKTQLTGDVNLDLKNVFGNAENVVVKWQQLQYQSPRLKLFYAQPYFLNSAVGIEAGFGLFKKDSSFLQINASGALLYQLNPTQSTKIGCQYQQTKLLPGAVDTNQIKKTSVLPSDIDSRSLNLNLEYYSQTTDFPFNPRKGHEYQLSVLAGTKKLRWNDDVISIKSANFQPKNLYDSIQLNTYHTRLQCALANYVQLGKYTVIKLAVHGGYYYSPQIFRNDLFQIGGNKLLRGFDEESIFASTYGVFTAEWRLLLSKTGYFSVFTDAATVRNQLFINKTSAQMLSLGTGLVYETGIGMLNISIAAGKRNDVSFNLRQATRVHIGYVNYF